MSETVAVEQEPDENEPPQWLVRAWQFYGRKQTFDMDLDVWEKEYPDISELATGANELFEAWPIDRGGWHLVMISLRPRGLERLKGISRGKPGPKTNARQITIGGREIDLRNRANFDLLNARIEDVENVTESYLHQLRNKPTKSQRRACICQLHRVMLLRGPQLRRDLFGSVCLPSGAPLPADFWHLPPEKLPNVGKTCSTPSFPLDREEKRFDSLQGM